MIKVSTETGSVYIIDEEMKRVRRQNDNSALRRDDKWLKYMDISNIEVGKSMTLILEPLGDGDCTLRQTSYITEIE